MTDAGMTSDVSGGPQTKRAARNWAKLKPNKPLVLSVDKQLTMAAEEYRSIAVQIEQNMESEAKGLVLAVTGCEPTCGKTLTSLNLALVLARRGERRVALVEADLWRPSLREYLDVEERVEGVGDILSRSTSVRRSLITVWGVGLDIILSGRSGDASDLMTGENLARLGSELKSMYELVIVDCPPVVLAGGRSLAGWADKSILVVRAGRTKRKTIEEALTILGPEKTLGMILNNAKGSLAKTYAYGKFYSAKQ